MRSRNLQLAALICVLATAPAAVSLAASDATEIRQLLEKSEILLRLGLVEKGDARSFEEADRLLVRAEGQLTEADLTPEDRDQLAFEVEAVREDLGLLTELYQERFYGVFPLARLTIPTLFADEGFIVTEQLFHPPDEAAVEAATRAFLTQLDNGQHPHAIVRSKPVDKALENQVTEMLLRDGRTTVRTRREFLAALSPQDFEDFEKGKPSPQLVGRVQKAVDAVNLMVLTVGEPVELDDATVRSLRGDLFVPGKVFRGSQTEVSPPIHSQNFRHFGFARDRRAQFWPIIVTQLVLLVLAMAWAAQVPWSIDRPLKTFLRLAIGATLFVFGRVFIIIVVVLLMRMKPDPNALVAAAWWWPAVLGLMAVLGGGVAAWIAQARLTDVVPGARGARAVGSIFALVTIGTSSYFVAPVLMLDQGGGFASLIPYVLASVVMAVLFGYAVRTGPPVPHYFSIGPLLVVPLLGVGLLMASPSRLWMVTGLAGMLSLAAWARHRYTVAHGTEEAEPSPEAAAEADQQKLDKLGGALRKKI